MKWWTPRTQHSSGFYRDYLVDFDIVSMYTPSRDKQFCSLDWKVSIFHPSFPGHDRIQPILSFQLFPFLMEVNHHHQHRDFCTEEHDALYISNFDKTVRINMKLNVENKPGLPAPFAKDSPKITQKIIQYKMNIFCESVVKFLRISPVPFWQFRKLQHGTTCIHVMSNMLPCFQHFDNFWSLRSNRPSSPKPHTSSSIIWSNSCRTRRAFPPREPTMSNVATLARRDGWNPGSTHQVEGKVVWLVVEPTPSAKYARQNGSFPQGSGWK